MPAAACFALAACGPLAAGTNLAFVLVVVVEAVEPVAGVMPPLRLQWQQELQP